jgi:antitoxin ParD1/3/4
MELLAALMVTAKCIGPSSGKERPPQDDKACLIVPDEAGGIVLHCACSDNVGRLAMFDNPCQSWYLSFLIEPEPTMTMNINLTPQLEKLVRQRVSSGLYNPASEVVREALRSMEAQHRLRAMKLEQLRRDIREGLESGPATPWDVAEMKRDGRKRLAVRAGVSARRK